MLTIFGPDVPFLGLIHDLDIVPMLFLVRHVLINTCKRMSAAPCTLSWPCEGEVCLRHSKSESVSWYGCWISLCCILVVARDDGAEGLGVPKGVCSSTHTSPETISVSWISNLYKQMEGLTFAVAYNLYTRVRLALFLVSLFTTLDNCVLIC